MIARLATLLKQERTKNFVLFSSASFISALIGVVTLHWFTDYLLPKEFGIWGFTLTFNSFISTIIVLDLHSYFLVESARNPEKRKQLLSTLVTFSFVWSLLLTGVFLLVGSLVFDRLFEDIRFYPYIVFILVSNVFACFSLFLQIVYRIENKPFYYFLFSIFQSVFAIFTALFIVVFFIHDAEGRVIGHTAGMLLAGLAALFVLWRFYGFRLTFDKALIRQALKFSAPLIPYSIAVLSMDFLDRVFLEQYGTADELGLFSLANQVNTIVYFIFVSLIRVYEPSIIVWINNHEHGKLNAFSVKYNLLLLLASGGLMLVAGILIFTLANENYYASTEIVIKMSPFFYLKSVSLLLLTILISGSKTFKTMYIALFMLAVYAIAGWTLIPATGMDGMIWIKTVVVALGCIVTFLWIGHPRAYAKLGLSIAAASAVMVALTYVIYKFHFYS